MLILPYKTWWKPRFPLVEGYIANIGISLEVFEFSRFRGFFLFLKKFGHPTSGSGGKIGLKIYHMKWTNKHAYTHMDGHRDSMKESAKGRFFENQNSFRLTF